MVMLTSSRDLISVFVALEFLSIPAYMMAAWKKRDRKSNEAGVKYYLLGVFASAVLLYGFSLLYGLANSTKLVDIAGVITLEGDKVGVQVLAVAFAIIGFAFKISAVPFHTWAPDTYEGAPTPVTAYLAVASKAAGFVALINVVFFCFAVRPDIVQPLFFVLSAATMTVGNLIALRQTNVVRMLAYSGIAQAGFILAPFVVVDGARQQALSAIVVYLVIYAAMTLGAFGVVIAVARTTGSAEIDSMGGLFNRMPGLTVAMTVFLASLIGIPPLGGWYAKFGVFSAILGAKSGLGLVLAVIMALNTVVAAYYYLRVAKTMWFDPVPDGARTKLPVPTSLSAAIVISVVATILFGVLPGLLTNLSNFAPIALGR
jgi:NADH-quinone oxidoreductase subunit N